MYDIRVRGAYKKDTCVCNRRKYNDEHYDNKEKRFNQEKNTEHKSYPTFQNLQLLIKV
jgi:hypothetical protein